jgi:hypothetical protein
MSSHLFLAVDFKVSNRYLLSSKEFSASRIPWSNNSSLLAISVTTTGAATQCGLLCTAVTSIPQKVILMVI